MGKFLPPYVSIYIKVLYKKRFGGAVLIYSPKVFQVFDTINHDFIIARSNAYRFDKSSSKRIFHYVNDISYRAKISENSSSLEKLIQGRVFFDPLYFQYLFERFILSY